MTALAPFGAPRRAWSQVEPGLQLGIDSTSLGIFKECPYKYELTIRQGWQPRIKSVDLVFGMFMHEGFETYYKSRADGQEHEAALRQALRRLMERTWDRELNRPIRELEDNVKNRLGLARALVWGLDALAKDPDAAAPTTHLLADGSAAAELSFRFDSGHVSRLTGEPFLLCGHIDRLVEFAGRLWVEDYKSTRHATDERYFSQFSPDNQISLYVLAGQVAFKEEIAGLIISAMQIGVNFVRGPRRQIIPRKPESIAEWHTQLGWWLQMMESCVESGVWPQNDKSCWGCEFRGICARPPAGRQQRLEADFVRRIWDPMVAR